MAPRFDFDLVIGDSYPPGDSAVFTVTYSVRPTKDADPVPYDITDATLGAELSRTKGGDSIVAFTLTKLDQNASPGKFTWRIPSSETAGLTPCNAYWRLFLSWTGSDSKITIMQGLARVRYAQP